MGGRRRGDEGGGVRGEGLGSGGGSSEANLLVTSTPAMPSPASSQEVTRRRHGET